MFDNFCKISKTLNCCAEFAFYKTDKGPMLELVDVLVRKYIVPFDIAEDVVHLCEVVEKVQQLMVCILDGLQRADDMPTIFGCSMQWTAVFELRNSR